MISSNNPIAVGLETTVLFALGDEPLPCLLNPALCEIRYGDDALNHSPTFAGY